jgi:hypothetical protein
MVKWWIGFLLLVNMLLFAVMQWGGALTVDTDIPVVEAEFNADKIKLLSDVPAAPTVAMASEVAVASAAKTSEPALLQSSNTNSASKAIRQCGEWGEFSGSGLAQVQTELAALSLSEKLTQNTIEHDSGFWVFLPPMKKRTDVQRKIEQLKQLGINDYFVVQDAGIWMNAISLGVFRTEKAAQKYLVSMQEKGVHSAKVGERKSKLKFTQFFFKDLDAVTADKIRNLQKDFPDNELKITDCN